MEHCNTVGDVKVSRHEHAVPLVFLGSKILDVQK